MALPVLRNGNQPVTAEPAGMGPFEDLERLHAQISQFLGSWWPFPSYLAGPFTPPADIEETDDAYLVEIELPGVQKGDLDIEVSGRRLSVRGERKQKERSGVLRRQQRTVGRFEYEVVLPGEVADSEVEANLSDGVLTVRLPKPAHDRPRRVPVN